MAFIMALLIQQLPSWPATDLMASCLPLDKEEKSPRSRRNIMSCYLPGTTISIYPPAVRNLLLLSIPSSDSFTRGLADSIPYVQQPPLKIPDTSMTIPSLIPSSPPSRTGYIPTKSHLLGPTALRSLRHQIVELSLPLSGPRQSQSVMSAVV